MVQKKEREYLHGPIPIDEAWWNSILEDVEGYYAPGSQNQLGSSDPIGETPEENLEDDGIDWGWVQSLYDQDQVVNLEVTNHNRGGLLVNGEGIQGFVPASHLVQGSKKLNKEGREELFSTYLGQSLQLKVIECDPERGRIVFSERAAQSDPGSRLELLSSLEVGDCIRGRVTTITNFGVFIDLGGVEGLVHVSELSWGRVCNPNDVVTIGDEVEVCILQIDHERNRVALSLKRLRPNPWDTIHDRYQIGQITNAVITNTVSYGAFARLEDGVDGLIHISGIEKLNAHQKPEDLFYTGQEVKVTILNIDASRQRLGLSLYTEDDAGS
jgi:small subunit ribosomal protein S1